MNALIVNDGNVKTATLKSGAVSTRALSRAEYRAAHRLTNAEAKRRYPTYLLELGKANNGMVAAALGSGAILITGSTTNPETGTGALKFVLSTHKSVQQVAVKDKAEKAEDKVRRLMAILEGQGMTAQEIAEALTK